MKGLFLENRKEKKLNNSYHKYKGGYYGYN